MGWILPTDVLNVIKNSINRNNVQDIYNYTVGQIASKYYTVYGLLFIPQPIMLEFRRLQFTSPGTPLPSTLSQIYGITVNKIPNGTSV